MLFRELWRNIMICYHNDMVSLYRPQAEATASPYEKPKPKPVIEQKREWQHGSEGKGENCSRSTKPIYTNPNEVPGTCRDWQCDNKEWISKGIVNRDKATRNIVSREK